VQFVHDAALVVVPLRAGLQYAAGVNGVLKAMAMGKALIVFATPGIADYVEDRVTARLVPPGDTASLRGVVAELLADHEQARRWTRALDRWCRAA